VVDLQADALYELDGVQHQAARLQHHWNANANIETTSTQRNRTRINRWGITKRRVAGSAIRHCGVLVRP
jgi:hypothetical protein